MAVVGSRYFTDYEFVKSKLNQHLPIDMIVSGGAPGVDSLAERYAHEHNIPCKIFPADWKRYGRGAGPIRNTLIVNMATMMIAFPGPNPKGTKDSITKAEKKNIPVYRYDVDFCAASD